jgi:hypothetical protein
VQVVSNETVDTILQKIMTEHSGLFTGVDKSQVIVLDSTNDENLRRLVDGTNTSVTNRTAVNKENILQLLDLWSIDSLWGTKKTPIIVQLPKSAPESKHWYVSKGKEVEEVIVGQMYRLEHLIGRGGFGDVYLGINVITGDKVAIKMESLQIRPLVLNENYIYDGIKGEGTHIFLMFLFQISRLLLIILSFLRTRILSLTISL